MSGKAWGVWYSKSQDRIHVERVAEWDKHNHSKTDYQVVGFTNTSAGAHELGRQKHPEAKR